MSKYCKKSRDLALHGDFAFPDFHDGVKESAKTALTVFSVTPPIWHLAALRDRKTAPFASAFTIYLFESARREGFGQSQCLLAYRMNPPSRLWKYEAILHPFYKIAWPRSQHYDWLQVATLITRPRTHRRSWLQT
jgi:hypothetical protein